MDDWINFFINFYWIILCYFLLRLFYILTHLPSKVVHNGRVNSMIVAGSGGHTAEILALLGSLSHSYCPRIYVVAASDQISKEKLEKFEEKAKWDGQYSFEVIPRSREVRQSWMTTIGTTLYATLHCIPIIWKHSPDLILCNGPGTCIPICLIALAFKIVGINNCIIVYVESICRVTTMSFSGKILYYFADYLFVQWPDLKTKYPKSIYLGRFV